MTRRWNVRKRRFDWGPGACFSCGGSVIGFLDPATNVVDTSCLICGDVMAVTLIDEEGDRVFGFLRRHPPLGIRPH